MVIFKANFARNRLVLRWFNVFLTGVIICSFNNNTLQQWTNGLKPLTSWLVPSFSQYSLRLVVSGHCLHVLVTKFQDKFASLRQVNSPYSWNKFQICFTDMYLIRFLPNFAVVFVFLWILRDFADLPELRGSVTARNVTSHDKALIQEKVLTYCVSTFWKIIF